MTENKLAKCHNGIKVSHAIESIYRTILCISDSLHETMLKHTTSLTKSNSRAASKWMHPVSFVPPSPHKTIQSFTIQQHPLVVWYDGKGKPVVMQDRCPHRGAKLSQGRLIGGSTNARIECPYHGWQFNSVGTCKRIPQASCPPIQYPKACNIGGTEATHMGKGIVHDGILWIGLDPDAVDTHIPYDMDWTHREDVFVTDQLFEAPYSAGIQIENLLDPAHIHYVHHGFQGQRSRAGPIRATVLAQSDTELTALFQSEVPGGGAISPIVPDIKIQYRVPSVIDVSIMGGPDRSMVVRKNIIFVAPIDATRCYVLFRDVAYKNALYPENPIVRAHLDLVLDRMIGSQKVEDSYDKINKRVIGEIMQQDIQVLTGQQENLLYYQQNTQNLTLDRVVLPTESDVLIALYRRWLKNQGKTCPFQ